MAGTFGWLLLIWIVGGWLSVYFYACGFVYKRVWKLVNKGDRRGAKAVADAAGEEGVGQAVFEFRRDHPDYNGSTLLTKYPVLMIFAWPYIGKMWIMTVGPYIQEVYEERLKVLEEKSVP